MNSAIIKTSTWQVRADRVKQDCVMFEQPSKYHNSFCQINSSHTIEWMLVNYWFMENKLIKRRISGRETEYDLSAVPVRYSARLFKQNVCRIWLLIYFSEQNISFRIVLNISWLRINFLNPCIKRLWISHLRIQYHPPAVWLNQQPFFRNLKN